MTEETLDYTLTYEDTPEAHKRVFDIMLAGFKSLELFNRESLAQSDATYIDAPEILGECAEKGFKFTQDWK